MHYISEYCASCWRPSESYNRFSDCYFTLEYLSRCVWEEKKY